MKGTPTHRPKLSVVGKSGFDANGAPSHGANGNGIVSAQQRM